MAAKKKKAKKKAPTKRKPVKMPPPPRPVAVPKCNQNKICDWLEGTAATLRFAAPLGYSMPAGGPAKNDAWTEHAQYCLELLVAAVKQLETSVYFDAGGNHIPGMPNPIFATGGGGTPPPPPPSYPPS